MTLSVIIVLIALTAFLAGLVCLVRPIRRSGFLRGAAPRGFGRCGMAGRSEAASGPDGGDQRRAAQPARHPPRSPRRTSQYHAIHTGTLSTTA